jgi:hypothetical protein
LGTLPSILDHQIVDISKCDTKRLCPPEAWSKFDGGFTYKLIMKDIRANLIAMCEQADPKPKSTDVQFE